MATGTEVRSRRKGSAIETPELSYTPPCSRRPSQRVVGMLRIIERRHQDSVNRKSKLSTSASCEVCAIRYDTGAVKLITPIVQRWISDGLRDPEGFWERAAEELPWFRRWDRVFEWDFPTFRWFVGAQTNICHTALDRHVSAGRGGHAALAYVNERGERVVLTYAQLLHEVTRLASALRGLGVSKGDRLTIYMPPCPESIALMLATVRIGAIHSVVFAGFGAKALADRVQASGSRLVFTADVTYRKGKNVRLKEIVDDALASIDAAPSDVGSGGGSGMASGFSRTVEHVIVLQRTDVAAPMMRGRDLTWDDFLAR